MAKSDAITDYTLNGHLSIVDFVPDLLTVWNANKATATGYRLDHAWSGDTTAAVGTPLSGWDAGTWTRLGLVDVDHDASYTLAEYTPAHSLIRTIKETFNLPNPGDDDDWANDYPNYAYNTLSPAGEYHYFVSMAKERASMPMLLSKSEMDSGSVDAYPSGVGGLPNVKCVLEIGVQGFDIDEGVDRFMSWTVRPDDVDVSAYNSHYKALADASTAAADYTDPSLVGEEFEQAGSLLLYNCENQFRPTSINGTEDRVALDICWSNHTYAEIKALMDAAVVTP